MMRELSTEKKKHILDAAERIMSQKGQNATISEISGNAGVFDSVLYKYFRNKEDLLFTLAEERIKEAIVELRYQLKGIREPVSKLGKFIWWQLYRHDTYKHFSNIVLFQCRSRHDFYMHKAFEQIQQVRQIFMEIIKEGISQGVFRANIKIAAVRDISFGLMDLECIMCLAAKETERTYSDSESVTDLILHMLSSKDNGDRTNLGKSFRIVKASERVFAERGYERATIKEIASLADVADGTVYQYFKNKEDLLYSTIEEGFRISPLKSGFQYHLNPVLENCDPKSSLDKLRRFIRNHFLIYLTQPWFAKVFVLQGIFNRQFFSSKAYNQFKLYSESIYPILDKGKAEGTIREEVNNRVVKNMILGAFGHTALRWIFAEKEPQFDKTKEINQIIDLIVASLSR